MAISPGTCANIDEQLFANLEVFEAGLKTRLLAARVLHFDETGMRCEKKLHWVHAGSSQTATFYIMHAKRGQEASSALVEASSAFVEASSASNSSYDGFISQNFRESWCYCNEKFL